MPEHAIEWEPTPHPLEPAIATAADTIEARLTPVEYDGFGAPLFAHQLSDAPNRVLRSSDIRDWETIMARLTDAERLEIAKRVV